MGPITEIDPGRLDEHWLEFSDRFGEYAEALAEAKGRLLRAEGILEYTKAEVSLIIRKSPDKYGIDGKLTEDTVKQQVVLHPKMKEANELWIKRKIKVEQLQAGMNTLNAQQKTLEHLVALFGMSWHSEPKLPKSVRNSVDSEKVRRHMDEKKKQRSIDRVKKMHRKERG